MGRGLLSGEDRAEIARLYGLGWTTGQLVDHYARYDIDTDDVLLICRRQGVEIRGPRQAGVAMPPLTDFGVKWAARQEAEGANGRV